MTLTELRHHLEAMLREAQLPEALQALLKELPDGSALYRIVSVLITRLNATNKERYRNTISMEEYQRRVDQISADFFDLLGDLKEADFVKETAEVTADKSGKKGSVLYKIPNIMTLQKPARCTIRVAVDEEAILENILLDKDVEIRSKVEISDVMSAELFDPEGDTFQITALNKHTQLVKNTGYTEWNFNVKPLKEGIHQLLVKVSIMEIVPGFAEPIPREVTLMETVTIVTETAGGDLAETKEEPTPDKPDTAFKSSGQSFSFPGASSTMPPMEVQPSRILEPPMAPQSFPAAPAPSAPKRSLRALAVLLVLIVLIPAATWAFAPDMPAWISAHYIQGTPEAYTAFIKSHQGSPRIEKAYFYRASASGQLADLRAYQERFKETGVFEGQVLSKIAALETRDLEGIREEPDRNKISQFVADFPETERLNELKKAVEVRASTRPELLAAVEDAYILTLQSKPTTTKVMAYLRDFPEQGRLNEVEAAARTQPEVFEQVQPALEDAYLKKMEQNPTPAQADQYLEKFPEPVRKERFEKILEQRPALKKEALKKMKKIETSRKGPN